MSMIDAEDFEKLHIQDPHFRNTAAMAASHLLYIASLPGFIDEIDGNTPELLGDNPRVERPEGKRAAEDLRKIAEGFYNAVVVVDRNKQMDIRKMYENAATVELLEHFLNKKTRSNITYLQAMKNAVDKEYQAKKQAAETEYQAKKQAAEAEQAPEAEQAEEQEAPAKKKRPLRMDTIDAINSFQLMDDLYYLDDKLELQMDLPRIDPDSAQKRKRMTGEPSWENYMKDHLKDIPHTKKGKEEYLAKAMVGAFFKEREGTAQAQPFSVKEARKYADGLRKNPVFQKMCENPVTLRKMLERAQKDPSKLYTTAMHVYRPFYGIDQEKRMEVLRKLKAMESLMDPPDGRSSSYRALYESIHSIDLDDPDKCGEEKLAEILEKDLAYLKGKKAYRDTDDKVRRFNQGMDVLFTLATVGPAAKMQAETVLDRVNEVRMKHEPVKLVRPAHYGPTKLPKHSLADAEKVNAFKQQLMNRPEEPKEDRFVFQSYPKNDQGLLPEFKQGKKRDIPLRVHTEINKAKLFAQDGGTGKRLSLPEAKENLARILALSDCKMYHLSKEEVPVYFANNKIDGKKIDGSIAVISKAEFKRKYNRYLEDPAVETMALDYTSPKSRQSLMSKEILTVEDGQQVKKMVQSEDPHDIDIQRLKREYAQARKDLEGPQIGV